MIPVPRRSERAADEVEGADISTAVHENQETPLLPVLREETALVPAADAPPPKVDPGLYAVLGLDPSAGDDQIKTTYRRLAAKLLNNGYDNQALKQLNVAYEVLGNPARRNEYDRMRMAQALAPSAAPMPIRPDSKAAVRVSRRRRPRQAVQPHYAGLGDVLVVLTVVGLAVIAGFLLIPRLSINLSALNALQALLPLSSNARPVITVTVTAVPTVAATATPEPSVSAQFSNSTVSVSNPNPGQNTVQNVQIHLKRDGQAVAGADVWTSVQYRTTQERWPATGTVKTDNNGAATISFNIGDATPNYPVSVHVFAQVEEQQLSWTTSFTPH